MLESAFRGGCLLWGGVCSRRCLLGGCLLWGCLLWGVSAPGGGCLLQGLCLLQGRVSILGGCLLQGGVSSQGGVCSGGCLLQGCLLWGVSASGGGMDRITDTSKNIPLAITSLRPVTMRLWTLQNNFLPVFCNFLSASIHCILCLGKNADTGIHHKRQKISIRFKLYIKWIESSLNTDNDVFCSKKSRQKVNQVT